MPLLIRDLPTVSEIEPGLFIGDFASSSDLSTLEDNNITAIVSLANSKAEAWSRPENRELVPKDCHMFVCCADSSTQEILSQLGDICDFIADHSIPAAGDSAGSSKSNVLVHCTAGVSRSATIVVAYLMRKNRQSLDTVLKNVKDKRSIEPSRNFMDQLKVWEAVGYNVWEDAERTKPKEAYREFLEHLEAKIEYKADVQQHRDCYHRSVGDSSR